MVENVFEKYIWVVFPIAFNGIWAVLAVFAGPQSAWATDGWGCVGLAIMSTILAAALIIGFFVHDIGPRRSFLAMSIQTVLLIIIFAAMYSTNLKTSPGDALYGSIVTWTSLGFSDLMPAKPSTAVKLVTAMQSIIGYVYLGLLVSILSSAVMPKDKPAGDVQPSAGEQ